MTEPILEKRYVQTSFGRIAYLTTGSAPKPPVLFVHGIPTSGYLWRDVLRFLQNDFQCYAPDLMGLGDTEPDPERGGYAMDVQAEMLLDFMTALGHETFALVCHDQGGAAAQVLVSRQPERVTCWVITDSVCYDNWPVPAVVRYQRLSRVPGLTDLLGRVGLVEWLERRSPLSSLRRGVYRRDRLADASIREYLRPLRGDARRREQFRRFLLAGHPRHTELALEGLRRFERPTLILWAADDAFLSPSWGRKLYEDIPGARRFELIPFCGHFWQEERPAEFASHIGEFLAEHLLHSRTQAEEPADPAAPIAIKKPRRRRALSAAGAPEKTATARASTTSAPAPGDASPGR